MGESEIVLEYETGVRIKMFYDEDGAIIIKFI